MIKTSSRKPDKNTTHLSIKMGRLQENEGERIIKYITGHHAWKINKGNEIWNWTYLDHFSNTERIFWYISLTGLASTPARLGIFCFVRQIVWHFWRKPQKASDPPRMLPSTWRAEFYFSSPRCHWFNVRAKMDLKNALVSGVVMRNSSQWRQIRICQADQKTRKPKLFWTKKMSCEQGCHEKIHEGAIFLSKRARWAELRKWLLSNKGTILATGKPT